MRVSSSTLPSLIGTLKSTRMKARLPFRSRSLIESFSIADENAVQSTSFSLPLPAQEQPKGWTLNYKPFRIRHKQAVQSTSFSLPLPAQEQPKGRTLNYKPLPAMYLIKSRTRQE